MFLVFGAATVSKLAETVGDVVVVGDLAMEKYPAEP
jgi:hypothetical protein